MAITKTAVTLIASAANNSAAGTTKTSPSITGASVNCTTYYGGELTYKITNGTAPGAPCTVVFQSSQDGTNWYDYQTVSGDVVASSINSGSIVLDRGVMYIRAIAYGNTTNTVTVEAYLQAVTAV